jgi:hypothetical protein
VRAECYVERGGSGLFLCVARVEKVIVKGQTDGHDSASAPINASGVGLGLLLLPAFWTAASAEPLLSFPTAPAADLFFALEPFDLAIVHFWPVLPCFMVAEDVLSNDMVCSLNRDVAVEV